MCPFVVCVSLFLFFSRLRIQNLDLTGCLLHVDRMQIMIRKNLFSGCCELHYSDRPVQPFSLVLVILSLSLPFICLEMFTHFVTGFPINNGCNILINSYPYRPFAFYYYILLFLLLLIIIIIVAVVVKGRTICM